MKTVIKNTSRAAQGVHTVEGLQFIEPGATRTLDVAGEYLDRLKALPFFEIGEDIDQPPTEDDIATWSRERLVEATISGVREEIANATDDELRQSLVKMYAYRGNRDPLDHDGDGEKGGSISAGASDDMTKLRAEYTELFAKRPYNGWDAAELQAKIDAKLAE